MKQDIIRLLIPAFCAVFLSPATISASPGSEAMPFTRVTHDPVSASMGGTSIVRTSGMAWSSYSNAAAIPYSNETFDVAASYQLWQPSGNPVNNISAGGAWNAGGKFGLSAGFTYGAGQKYDTVNSSGQVTGNFTPSEMQVNIGLAWKFLPFLSLGANVKYLNMTLAEGSGYGAVSSDIFLMTKLAGWRIAAGVSSIGSKVTSAGGEKFRLPASVTLGAGYGHVFGDRHGLDIMAEADWYMSGTASVSAGASYTYNDLVSVRAGYRYGGDSVIPSYASVGAGVEFLGIRIDAAYLIATGNSLLKNTFTVGAGFSF